MSGAHQIWWAPDDVNDLVYGIFSDESDMSRVDNFIELWLEFILRLVFIFVRLLIIPLKYILKR